MRPMQAARSQAWGRAAALLAPLLSFQAIHSGFGRHRSMTSGRRAALKSVVTEALVSAS